MRARTGRAGAKAHENGGRLGGGMLGHRRGGLHHRLHARRWRRIPGSGAQHVAKRDQNRPVHRHRGGSRRSRGLSAHAGDTHVVAARQRNNEVPGQDFLRRLPLAVRDHLRFLRGCAPQERIQRRLLLDVRRGRDSHRGDGAHDRDFRCRLLRHREPRAAALPRRQGPAGPGGRAGQDTPRGRRGPSVHRRARRDRRRRGVARRPGTRSPGAGRPAAPGGRSIGTFRRERPPGGRR
jgi:hypothetical protein